MPNATSNATPLFRPVQLQVSCRNLRHKMMYCDERQSSPGLIDDTSDTRVFFCIKTFDALGPDHEPVCPKSCTHSRACYHESPAASPNADNIA
ncbi:MAG: hypothetical protein AB7Q00_10020 [Phycisphaerales bacterium]|nr:MAG: hypothetical protein IPK69_13325 [Phycisphaerales bacterium]